MATPEKVTEPTVSWSDYRYLQDQLSAQKKMMRLLIRILVDKKIIGEELAKTFEESKKPTKEDLAKLVDWLFK